MADNQFGRADWWQSGGYNAICDVCGFKWKASQMLLRWDGLYVCPPDFEPRQPQDFVRGVPDKQTPDWTRPPAPPNFIYFCDLQGRTAFSGYATSGCAISGNSVILFENFVE